MVLAVEPTPGLVQDEPLPSVHIGPRLKQLRERVGLKQVEIARLMHVDPAVPSTWEGGNRYRPVPGNRLRELAELLEVPVRELLVGCDDLLPRHLRPAPDPPPAAAPPLTPTIQRQAGQKYCPACRWHPCRCPKPLEDETCPCRYWRQPDRAAREVSISAWTFDMPFQPRQQLCCLGCHRHYYTGPGYGPHRCTAGGS